MSYGGKQITPLPDMADWQLWYDTVIVDQKKNVFLVDGELAGGVAWSKSTYARELFCEGTIDYLGKVFRVCPMKHKEAINSSFVQFMKERPQYAQLETDAYLQAQPSLIASFRSIAKYDKKQPELDEVCWVLSGLWTMRHWQQFLHGSQIISLDNAWKMAEKRTSPGYPWNLWWQFKGEIPEEVRERIFDDFWDDVSRVPEHRVMRPIWTCSQKRELRSIEKRHEDGTWKIRTFTASPVEHSVLLSMYCFDFNNRFYNSHSKTWSEVGSSKYLGGWDQLYRKLDVHPNAYETDASSYDASIFQKALEGQRDIRWMMMDEKDRTEDDWVRLYNLYDDIIHSVIVLENGELVRKHTGNPSGSANTIVDNTMILFRLMCYAFIRLARKEGVPHNYELMVHNVSAALYGDDNTFTVSDKIVSWFNAKAVADQWSQIGIVTTSPDWNARKVEQCEFLSQSFVKKGGMWLPCPEAEKVLASLKHGSAADDVRWHLLRACALRNDSWANDVCRPIIDDYIRVLKDEHKDEMVGEVNGIKMEYVLNLYKTDFELSALYRGFESKSCG